MEGAPSGAERGRDVAELTLLFTDIEGSTRHLKLLKESYVEVLQRHHAAVRRHLLRHLGREVDTEGDAFFAVFTTPDDAVAAAAAIQRALSAISWPQSVKLRVRIGIHTGFPTPMGTDFVGLDVHAAARICAAAHGGQVLLSEAVVARCGRQIRVRDLGDHRLKDFDVPVHLFQLLGPGLGSSFPPVRSIGGRPNNLPAPVDDLVGRDRELAELTDLLSNSRLVTVTGVGGIGKTRLALTSAANVVNLFEGGAWFVRLDDVTDGRFMPHAIASAIGLRHDLSRPVFDVLVDYLSSRRVLLVLDNFEHLLEAAATVAEILSRAPQLVVLVTSRAALHLPGERVYSVPPMATSTSSGEWPGAAELFRRRTIAAGGDLPLDEVGRESAVTICERLDGLPLAIELAASRVRTIGLRELSRRLDHRLDLLRGEARGGPTRHRTLRKTIAWSYELLDEPEQQVFRSVAVFRGGWTLAAAAFVSGHGVDGALDVLTSLVDKSLISCESSTGRYRMLETLREFALSQMEPSKEEPAALEQHALYFTGLALECTQELAGPAPILTLDRLEAERDNLRAAILWAVSVRRPDLGVSIAAPIWRFYHLRSHLSEGKQLLEDLLAVPEDDEPHSWQASAALALGAIGYWQQDFESSQRNYQNAAHIYQALDDAVGFAQASDGLAYPLIISGRLEEARQRLRDALQIFRQLADREGSAGAVYGLALADVADGQFDSASLWAEQSLAEWNSLGNTLAVTNASCLLASIRREQRSPQAATELLLSAADVYLRLDNLSGLHWILSELAALNETSGDLATAVLLASAADSISGQIDGGVLIEKLRITAPYAHAETMFGGEQVDELRARGSRLDPREAIDLARSAGQAGVKAVDSVEARYPKG